MDIENLKGLLRQIEKVSEYVELAEKIRQAPITLKSREDLAEIHGYITNRVNHLHANLIKGVAIEEDLEKIADFLKDMPGTDIFVYPGGYFLDHQNIPSFSKS